MASRAENLDLEIDDSFQKNEWLVQRLGWIVWVLILAAGIAGLLGPGPLSSIESRASDDSLTVKYDRFLHYHHPTQLELALGSIEPPPRELQVKLNGKLLDRIQIQRIEPEPERTELGDGVIYTFLRSGSSSAGSIVFHVDFERFGRSRGTIGVVGHESVAVNQFVYP
jgi:hypothetical protein